MSGGLLAIIYAAFCGLAISVNLGLQLITSKWLCFGYWTSLVVGTGGGLVFKYVLDRNYIFRARGVGAAKDASRFLVYAGFGLFTTGIFWTAEWVGHASMGGEAGRYVGGGLGLCIGYALKYWMDRRWVFQSTSGNL